MTWSEIPHDTLLRCRYKSIWSEGFFKSIGVISATKACEETFIFLREMNSLPNYDSFIRLLYLPLSLLRDRSPSP